MGVGVLGLERLVGALKLSLYPPPYPPPRGGREKERESEMLSVDAEKRLGDFALALRAADAPPPATVRVGVVGATGESGIYVAQEKGYFREQGITIEWSQF